MRERGGELGDVDLPVADTRPLGREAGRRRLGEIAHAGLVDVDAVVDPADPDRALAHLLRLVGRREDDRDAPSEIGGRSCLRSGAVMYGSARSLSGSSSPLTCAYGLPIAFLRLRAAISAISRSVIVPLSIIARAWSAASDTGSAPSGVSVYGSIWSG